MRPLFIHSILGDVICFASSQTSNPSPSANPIILPNPPLNSLAQSLCKLGRVALVRGYNSATQLVAETNPRNEQVLIHNLLFQAL